ncbi:unnamed protein product [Spirodela intermedia]|uniref:Integrase catalytic domain-containing protein n=1 Tax=Spirodela intermedia TaxID=51605 RepID=A0A7I8I8Z3_SPIIN|nr:unnamed protein product [Spirodela intermedia]CAA6654080.1 unnamed protein product [Spirodela intermedia]
MAMNNMTRGSYGKERLWQEQLWQETNCLNKRGKGEDIKRGGSGRKEEGKIGVSISFVLGHRCRWDLNILIIQEEEKSQEDFQDEDWAPLELCSHEEGTLFTARDSLNSLREELSLPVSEFHSYAAERELKRSHICALELHQLFGTSVIAVRLQKWFPQVFETLSGLLLERTVDHAINLLPGTQPIIYDRTGKPNFRRMKLNGWSMSYVLQASFNPLKDGSWQFCIDYKALNKSTVPNRFPILIVDEFLEELHGMSIFSKLDLKSDYYQIHTKQEDIQKTAFKTHEEICIDIFDDILVYSKIHKEHDEHLDNVLFIFSANSLYVNEKKCQFRQSQLEYLSLWIPTKGVSTDQGKISAIWDWPTPKDLKALRGFLGLTSYYHQFVKYSNAQDAFHKLKVTMTSTLVLALLIFSQKFLVETDASGHGIYQYSLKFLLDQKEIHSEYHKWVIKLMEFNFQIQYKEGKKNTTADALSRAAQLREAVVAIMCIAQGIDVTKINKEVEDDVRLSKIKIALIEGSTSFPHYSIQQGSLLYKRLLQPLPILNMTLEDLSMDFIEGLPKSKCCDSILVIVDRINKFGHFIPLRHLFTPKDITQIFAKESIKLHGIPRSIVTDRGTVFTSTFWKALNKLQGIELKMSSFYHPQTDEQTEDPPTLTCYGSPMSPIIAVNTYVKERNDTLQLLKEHLLAAQLRPYHMKSLAKKANEKLSPRIFDPYPIQERIGQVAYKLELPTLGNSAYYQPIPSILTDALEWNVTPQDILAIRNSSFDTEVLAPRTYARRKKAQSPIS